GRGQGQGDAGALVAQVDGDHVRAVGGPSNRVCATLAARSSGDERDFAVQGRVGHPRSCPLSGSPAGTGSSILISGAPTRCSPAVVNILVIAGPVLCALSASGSAHCSTKTKVSPASCTEYNWELGSSCTSSSTGVTM